MEMNIEPILPKRVGQPVVIAGPCSAETEEQVLQTAKELREAGVELDYFRAGIWKPRTRPNSFEGVGQAGLPWLSKVKKEYGFKTCTEVANAKHVFHALKHDVDLLWIGARTTVNPFSVQEVADVLEGVDKPVLVKNPINADLGLWIGAIERLYKAGITKIGAIHRGFSEHGQTKYRNTPYWEIPIELKRRFPEMMLICDNSHICGRRDTLLDVAQQAMNLNYDGVMTETHPNPDEAWSDAKQQITPKVFRTLLDELIVREEDVKDASFNENMYHIRKEIDKIDKEIIKLFVERMDHANAIGDYKKRNNISIFQPARFDEILQNALDHGKKDGLSETFIRALVSAMHLESINHQNKLYQKK